MDLNLNLNPSNKISNIHTQTSSPLSTQPTIKSYFPFTNGSFKCHASPQPHPPQSPPIRVLSYKECLKNHAATIGGYAMDGCGEFLPSATFNSNNDPTSLICAACGCHRNFHRRETQYSNPNSLNRIYPLPQAPPPSPLPGLSPSSRNSHSASPSPSIPSPESSPSPPPLSQFSAPSYYASAPYMLLALGNMHGTAPSEQHRSTTFNNTDMKTENPTGKKRSRTQFSREQKEKMYRFSEKLGWKMQRVKEKLVQQFCDEIGVSRSVFKVWMHNNKKHLQQKMIRN